MRTKGGSSGIPLSPTLTPSMRAGPKNMEGRILGDPGADSGGEGKSKRAEKYGTI